MAGIREVIEGITEAIQAVIPRADPTCRFVPRPGGGAEAPYDWLRNAARSTRQFEVTPAAFEETGACWLTAEIEVGVVYRAEAAASDIRPYEDAGAIVKAMRNPAYWSSNVASVTPLAADKLEIVDVAGRPSTRLLLMIVRVEYYEN